MNAWDGRCIDAPALQISLDRIAGERGVRVYLQSFAERIVTNDDGAPVVVMTNKSGRQAIQCRSVIDTTETGRVSRSAGLPFTGGSPAAVVARRAMLMAGADLADGLPLPFDVPEALGAFGNRAHVRKGLWPGDAIVWADFAGLEAKADSIERETLRRMTRIAGALRARSPQFADASLMLVA